MSQALTTLNDSWEVIRNKLPEFPDGIDLINLDYSEEDLLWLRREDYNIDLGIYGQEPFFGLYLYKGSDWHNCQLLEKRRFTNFKLLINCFSDLIQKVEIGAYNNVATNCCSIDEFSDYDFISVLEK